MRVIKKIGNGFDADYSQLVLIPTDSESAFVPLGLFKLVLRWFCEPQLE
jgi:hypothetical protein